MASNHGQFNTSLADPSFCPFGEELHPLQLHLEGLSDTSYLNLSRHFFLRDIGEPRAGSAGWGCPRGTGGSREGLSPCSDPPLSTVRPGPPQELTLQQRGEQLHLAWAPPASWPLPKSYFTLLYHLQYELHNGTQVTAGSLPRGTLHRLPRVPTLPCAHPAPSLTLPCAWEDAQPRIPPHSAASLLGMMNCPPCSPQCCPGQGVLVPPSSRVSLDRALPPLQVEQFVEGAEETPVQVGARRVRISCRDPYTPPAWSPWSTWMDLNAPQ